MKTIITITIAILLATNLFGQSPASFNYQAVLRDASGTIRVNIGATIRIDILQGSATGTVTYAESFAVTTNNFGLINLQVGKGSVISGTFSTINWANGPYFMKVSVDGTEMGTSQLLSVPYALYADKAANGFSGNYNDLINKPVILDNTLFNTAIGNTALFSNTTGNYNVAIGRSTLYYNTQGSINTAIGSFALYNNTIGIKNTANGANALSMNREGNENTALGFGANANNTSGNYNTAIGSSSLYLNNIGNRNTSIGAYSLYSNIKGNYNTAIGSYSLYKNQIGRWNTAIGDSALMSVNNDKNTAIGYKALAVATGWDNTSIGFQSLKSNLGGFDNVAVGVESLNSNTSGNGNTAVGKNAMIGNTSGSNNTAIGFNADVAGNASNSTAIGYNAYVNASNKIVIGNSSATTIGGFGSWSNYSDRRLKENIIYSNKLGLNFITRLKPASYNYIEDTNKRRRDGLIAQDVQLVLKELGVEFSGLVVDNDNDKTLNLSYAEFVLPLINAVQELNKKNLLLEQQNQQLQQKGKTMEASLNEMKAEIEKLKQLIENK